MQSRRFEIVDLTLEQVIRRMEATAATLYAMAQSTGHHQFLEFTGFLNEYINLCREAMLRGEDFRNQDLTPQSHHVKYVIEKLDCIYGPAFGAEARRQGYLKAKQ